MTTLDREAFLAERRTGIGGSDLAAILELSPWRTPLDVFREKLGFEEPKPESPAMRWGTLLEDAIAEEYSAVTGRRVRRANKLRRSKAHPHMIAHLDRDVVGEPRVLEIKTVGRWADMSEWGETGTDQVPPYYRTQCLHYMAVTGAEVCDLAALIAGQDFRVYEIPRVEKDIEGVVEVEHQFWHENVQKMIAPPPRTLDDLKKLWPRSITGRTVEASEPVMLWLAELERGRALAKHARAIEDEAKLHLGELLTDAEFAVDAEGLAIADFRTSKRAGYTVEPGEVRALKITKHGREILAAHTPTQPQETT